MEEDTTWQVPSSQLQMRSAAYHQLLENKISRSMTLQKEMETTQMIQDLVQQTATRSHTQPNTSMIRCSQDQGNSIFEPFEVTGLLSSSNGESFQELISTQEILKDKPYNGIQVNFVGAINNELNELKSSLEGEKNVSYPAVLGIDGENKENVKDIVEHLSVAETSIQLEKQDLEMVREPSPVTLPIYPLQKTEITAAKKSRESTPLKATTTTTKRTRKRERRPSTTGDLIYTEGIPKGKRNRMAKDSGYYVEIGTSHDMPLLLSSSPSRESRFEEVSDSDIDLGGSLTPRIACTKIDLQMQGLMKDEINAPLDVLDTLVVIKDVGLDDAEKDSDDQIPVCSSQLQVGAELPAGAASNLVEVETSNNVETEKPPVKRQNQKSTKTLAEICASTSSAYFKPRVGLSRRSNIECLHKYLKKTG